MKNNYEIPKVIAEIGCNHKGEMEIAKQLSDVAESAHSHILGEQDDWFDKISVNKNMKTLKGSVMEFQKTAKEAHALNQRLTGLYEDMGHILNRYYDISEGDGLVGESLDHLEGDDIDKPDREGESRVNDLDGTPKTESLDADKTAAKDGRDFQNKYASKDGESMKESSPGHRTGGENDPDSGDGGDANGEELRELKRSLKDIGGVVGIPSLGQFARKFSGK